MMVDSDSFNKIFALAALATMMVLAGAMIVSLDDSDAATTPSIEAGQTKTFTFTQMGISQTQYMSWYNGTDDRSTSCTVQYVYVPSSVTSSSADRFAALTVKEIDSTSVSVSCPDNIRPGTYTIHWSEWLEEIQEENDLFTSSIEVTNDHDGSSSSAPLKSIDWTAGWMYNLDSFTNTLYIEQGASVYLKAHIADTATYTVASGKGITASKSGSDITFSGNISGDCTLSMSYGAKNWSIILKTVSSSSGGSTNTLHYLDNGGTLPNMGTSSSPLSSFSITMDHKGFWKDATMYIYKGSSVSIKLPYEDEIYDTDVNTVPTDFGLSRNRISYGLVDVAGTLSKTGTITLELRYTDDYDHDDANITWTINVVESPTEYTCHLNFDMAGGTGGPDNLDYSSIQTTAHEFTVPSTAPSKEGYQFMGWAASDAPTAVRYHGGDTVPVAYNATVTLVAVWQAIAPQQVSITFGSNNTDYGKVSEGAIIVQKGSSYRIDGNCLYFGDITVRAEPEVAPSGYVNSFKNWSVTEEGIINEGMYIIATFEQVQIPVDQTAYYAKLVFDANGGSDAPNSIIMQALSASRPGNVEITVPDTAPVRAGHTFNGWADTSDAKVASYRAGDKVSVAYDTDISKVTTIYAVWSANCEITFNSNGGSDVQSITVKSGDKAREPSAPVRAGYTFAGWYTADDRAYDWNSPVTSSFVLKAKWNDDRVTFTVSFDTMGAKAIPSIAVTKGHAIDKKQMPEDPVKEGYEFGGWYLDEDCKKSFDVSSEINESFTLYAKWVAEENNFVVDHAVALIGIALFILGAFLYVRDYENKFIPVALLGLAIVVCHLVGWTGAVDDFIKGFF